MRIAEEATKLPPGVIDPALVVTKAHRDLCGCKGRRRSESPCSFQESSMLETDAIPIIEDKIGSDKGQRRPCPNASIGNSGHPREDVRIETTACTLPILAETRTSMDAKKTPIS
jgi:hypothetical protein